MLIINKKPLEIGEALANDKHPLHRQAVEYDRGLKELKKLYPDGKLNIVRVGYPKYVDGIDHQGRDVRNLPEPTPPARFPLSTNYATRDRGMELWACCKGEPKILPGNLFDLGDERSFPITDTLVIDINNEPDFAYYVFYISKARKGGHIKVDDPKEDARRRGDLRKQKLRLDTAIWDTDDETIIRKAQSWGVADTDKLEPNIVREELERVLAFNDDMKRKDPSYRGTEEFLAEIGITDVMRLRSFIRHWMDEGMITYKPDGRYRVGDKVIAQVPSSEASKKFPWLCNYFAAPNNQEKAQELLLDLVNKEYLDSITDEKDFRWLAKVMDIQGYYNQSAERVEDMVRGAFNYAPASDPVEEVIVKEEVVKKTVKK